ncbi:hypothetical protein K435DRAFT_915752, partial [Dendrothele bispora CBS 962.96]
MEFYLVNDLECDLTIFHPYRTLLARCKKETVASMMMMEAEAGELQFGVGGDLFIIHDSYRSNLCLLYPPHLIPIAAIYLTLVLNPSAQATINHLLPSSSANNAAESSPHSTEEPGTVVSSHFQSNAHANTTPHPASSLEKQDPIEFLANLNVSLSLVSTISQEFISLYTL